MRYLIIILFLTFISCKNETKKQIETVTESENELNKSVSVMWNDYIKVNPEFKDSEIPESDFFHNNRVDAKRLAVLTLNGKKKASSGLYSLYKQYKINLPKVKKKQIVTDFDGKEMAIIEITSVDTIPFNKISKAYAKLDMGTDIEPLEK